MADSYWSGTTDGTTKIYTVPFPYLEQSDVVVEVNSVPQLVPGDFTWLNAGSFAFNTAPPADFPLTITRQTSPDSPLVTFQGGAVTPADLNTANLQAFYRTQEIQDQLNQLLYGGIQSYLGQGAIAGLTPAELIAQVTASVLNGQLAQSLQAAITDISTNAQSIAGQATQLNTLTGMVNALTNPVLDGLATYLTDETNARITGDEALASTISLIGAQSSSNGAFILNSSNVYVDSTTSLADSLAGLLANFNANQAAITSAANVAASANSATASTVTALQSTVAGNTAAIATTATTVDGLSAQYTVKVDVNGHVAGFGLASTPVNGTPFSQFIVNANEFAIIDPGNGSTAPTSPFTVVGGVVYMDNVVINGALIEDGTIITANIANGAITNALIADLAVTAANIANATITNAQIANATITAAKIANATITNAQIANATITSALIANAAIGTAQIGDLAVTNAQIANLTVGSEQITNGATSGNAAWSTTSITASPTIVSGNYTSIGGTLVVWCRARCPNAGVTFAGHAATGLGTFYLNIDGTNYDFDTPTSEPAYTGMCAVNLAAGAHAVEVNWVANGGQGSGASGTLVLIELKK